MVELLSLDDFKHIDPNGDPFEWLLQIAKFEGEKLQENHDHGRSNGFEYNAQLPEFLCKKESMGFEKNGGKKSKRKLKEEDGDGDWGSGLKPKLKRRKKQKPQSSITTPDMPDTFKRHILEDGDRERGSELKSKLKRIKKQKPSSPIPTPDMPDRFKRYILEDMGGSGLVLVIQKTLFFSDVNHTASRFSVPFSQVKSHDFLTKTEADDLAHKKPMQVCFLDPSMEKTTMTFNRWDMGKNSLYVMIESWNSVVESNKLKKDEIVQIWSFRMNSELCFALVRV
ncbi:putative B3 domain-containing protein At2g27410 [Hibiscus syriacus]|uniref:putative B3 domain-containing protein At2g27410 n=1 Tax=Hibiscus syriacus TaxID=106335 RepID=UPI001924C95B|nr:putative B3 domain-containing protein At2g27410 [Hibiscus syriacus]